MVTHLTDCVCSACVVSYIDQATPAKPVICSCSFCSIGRENRLEKFPNPCLTVEELNPVNLVQVFAKDEVKTARKHIALAFEHSRVLFKAIAGVGLSLKSVLERSNFTRQATPELRKDAIRRSAMWSMCLTIPALSKVAFLLPHMEHDVKEGYCFKMAMDWMVIMFGCSKVLTDWVGEMDAHLKRHLEYVVHTASVAGGMLFMLVNDKLPLLAVSPDFKVSCTFVDREAGDARAFDLVNRKEVVSCEF